MQIFRECVKHDANTRFLPHFGTRKEGRIYTRLEIITSDRDWSNWPPWPEMRLDVALENGYLRLMCLESYTAMWCDVSSDRLRAAVYNQRWHSLLNLSRPLGLHRLWPDSSLQLVIGNRTPVRILRKGGWESARAAKRPPVPFLVSA